MARLETLGLNFCMITVSGFFCLYGSGGVDLIRRARTTGFDRFVPKMESRQGSHRAAGKWSAGFVHEAKRGGGPSGWRGRAGMFFALGRSVKKLYGSALAVSIFLLFIPAGEAANFYVRQGATGANNGSDWNNAWTDTANIAWSSLSPGDSVWVAGGTYTSIRAARSGSSGSPISILRVRTTNSVPASAAGWSSSFDSPVTIASTAPVTIIGYSYITIDGQVPWQGIIVTNTAAPTDTAGRYAISLGSGANGITLKNLNVRLCNNAYNVGSGMADRRCVNIPYLASSIASGLYIGYCDLAWGDTLMSVLYQSNIVVEHNRFHGNNRSSGGPHQNIWQTVGCTNVTFRYNDIGYGEGYQEECMMMDFVSSSDAPNDNWYIYGNLFHTGIENSRVLESQYNPQYRIHFFNNTICGTAFAAIRPSGSANGGTWDSTCVSTNNILINSGPSYGVGFGIGTDDYNLTDGTTAGAHSISAGSAAIFVNAAGQDYHIVSTVGALYPKDKGLALQPVSGQTLSADFDGNIRGLDGAWDIGAYEYSSATVSTNPPVVMVTAPLSNAVVSGSVTLSASATDSLGIGTVTFLVDGALVGTSLNAPYSFVWNTVGVSNGTHLVTAQALDLGGNLGVSLAVPVSVQNDTTPPSVSISTPLANATVSNAVTLSASATDSTGGGGISSVTFFVDGAAVGAVTSAPYTTSWNSASVANGAHTIQAQAVDAAGNQGMSSVITVTVGNPVAPPPTLTTGLIGYWKFDDGSGTNAVDSSGEDNTANLVRPATWGVGIVGGCVSLNGTNGYVRVPSQPNLEQITNAVTIATWIKISPTGDMQTIARKVLDENTNLYPYAAYDLVIQDNGTNFTPRMGVTRADSTRGLAYGNTHNYGSWYYLVGTYDGTNVTIYVNGVQEGIAAFSGAIIQTPAPLCIGRYGTVAETVNGSIDEFRLYNRALSGSEVLNLYQAPKPPSGLHVIGAL